MGSQMSFYRNQSVAYRFVEDEAVVVLPDADKIFVMNSTGSWIWDIIESGLSVEDIASKITGKCSGLCKEEVLRDVQNFIETLKTNSLIFNDSNGSTESVMLHVDFECNEYEPPKILAEEEIAVVAGLCSSGHSGDPLCMTAGPACTTLFSP